MSSSADAEPTIDISRNDDAGRYEIRVDDELAGFTAFVDRDGQRIFPHTEIDEKFGGRGLATKVIAAGLADARDSGKRIVAVCPAVVRFLEKNPDVAAHSDPVTPAILRFLKSGS